MSTSPHEYLTVAEAAELLRVSVSTIRRWIRDGTMSAHRVGRRRLLLRRGELMASVLAVEQGARSFGTPSPDHRSAQPPRAVPIRDENDEERIRQLRARLGLPPPGEAIDLGPIADRIVHSPDRPIDRRLTPEEQARALAAIERSEELSHLLLAQNGGQLFSDSSQIINEMRDERTRQLMGEEEPDSVSTQ